MLSDESTPRAGLAALLMPVKTNVALVAAPPLPQGAAPQAVPDVPANTDMMPVLAVTFCTTL
jgi:hypothetical protein